MYSTTYVAAIVSFLTLVLPAFGVHIVDPAGAQNAIMTIVGALSVLYTFYGRYKAGGIDAFGFKLG